METSARRGETALCCCAARGQPVQTEQTEEEGQSARLSESPLLAGEKGWNLKAAAGRRLGCHQASSQR